MISKDSDNSAKNQTKEKQRQLRQETNKEKQGQLRQESNKGKTNQENTAATQTGSSDGFPILTLLEERGFPRQSLIADNLNHIFHYQANAWLCKFFWGVFH